MSYGIKRWLAGMLFSFAMTNSIWLFSTEQHGWIAMAGIAIVAFFADYRIKPEAY